MSSASPDQSCDGVRSWTQIFCTASSGYDDFRSCSEIMTVESEDGYLETRLLGSTECSASGVMHFDVTDDPARHVFVLCGDGSWHPEDARWGVGFVSRTTGEKWTAGGALSIDDASWPSLRVDAAVIEAFAVQQMLMIGYERGARIRLAMDPAADSWESLHGWDAFCKHLIVATDRPALIGNLVGLFPRETGVITEPAVRLSPQKKTYDLMTEEVMYSIGSCCTCYERVSIICRKRFSENDWRGKDWMPHDLAAQGRENRKDRLIQAREKCHTGLNIRLRSFSLIGSVYSEATFSFDWDSDPSGVGHVF